MVPIAVNDALLQIFDVEHGACSLLTTPDGLGGWKRLLIDCGHNATTRWYPGQHLRQQGVTLLEQLVITNYDEDHASGYPDLLAQGIYVDWIARNTSVEPGTIAFLKSETGMGEGIDALAQSLQAFGPAGGAGVPPPVFPGVSRECFFNSYPDFDDENNLSLVLYLSVFGKTFLFPGDMERRGFEHLLATNPRFQQVVGNVDVLIASHHGRRSGVCPAMFDTYRCRPTLVVISDDYKQYDTQETTAYYAAQANGISNFRGSGIDRKVLTTRCDGEIAFSFRDGMCRVS